ncbi:putative Phosphatidylinositol-3-phosphatase SAC1 (putative) [Pseudozyma hubeiensis]|nr:putative Phosphatidylinositol-3-phosphatase SAC1 (putative) [Pseudozyma hubeiensis]
MFKAIFASSGGSSKQPDTKPGDASVPGSPSKRTASSASSSPSMSSVPLPPSRASSSVMASWTVPPFPHPSPERRVGILPTEQGLLIYPRTSLYSQSDRHNSHHRHHASATQQQHAKASTTATSNTPASRTFGSGDGFKVATVGASSIGSLSSSAAGILPSITSLDVGFLIDWSKQARITPLQPSEWKPIVDDATTETSPLECFGIVGLSRFFSSSYLFVITSSKPIGHYFHESRPIYCCTGVLAIPLLYQEATQAIRSQLTRLCVGISERESDTHAATGDVTVESDSDSDSESSYSDYDDVQTPAAIPKEPFFSSISSSDRADTLRMPKSRPWLTKAARAVSDGRIQTVLEDPVLQSQLADATEVSSTLEAPQSKQKQTADLVDQSVPSSVPVVAPATPDELWHAAKQAELEEKAVRETAKYWARGEFWFSYDFDLTTSLQNKRRALDNNPKPSSAAVPKAASKASHQTRASTASSSDATAASSFPLLAEPYPNLPLWRRADRRFWHNEHMSKDLIHAGLHAYILPIMQGYLQTVELPVQPVRAVDADSGPDAVLRCQMMVISRRSKERAGLRYQRRGINESGQVANFVETEQILSVLRNRSTAVTSTTETVTDVLSFVQIRGSIPLYWSQSPFSLKPPPVLERTEAETTAACRKHFAAQVDRYGSITCINLAEQGGKEGEISKAYRTAAEKLRTEKLSDGDADGKPWDRSKLHYVDFDFHKECSGMKFENVAKLITQMGDTLADMKYYHHRTSGAAQQSEVEVLSRQTGVFRVSCLDCLDRTNVVQSAFARHVLTGQLSKLAISVGTSDASTASS